MNIREMELEKSKEKIGINICYLKSIKIEGKLKEILYGIEEEGLPYIVESMEARGTKELVEAATTSSKLGVGIGIGNDGISLSTEKLLGLEPLFKYELNNNIEVYRAIGMNSARIVKREPLIIPKGGR